MMKSRKFMKMLALIMVLILPLGWSELIQAEESITTEIVESSEWATTSSSTQSTTSHSSTQDSAFPEEIETSQNAEITENSDEKTETVQPRLNSGPPSTLAEEPLLQLSVTPKINGKFEYYAGEIFTAYVNLDMSSIVASYPNAKLIISLPSTYIFSNPLPNQGFRPSDLETASGSPVTETDGIMSRTYIFPNLVGGKSYTIPVELQSKRYDTPGNYELPLTATLYDAAGNLLKTATQIFTQKLVSATLEKLLYTGNSFVSADGSMAFGGKADPNDPNLISTDGAAYLLFSFGFKTPNIGTDDNGSRRIQQIEITDTLPPGAVFDQAANPAWTYDAATNTVTAVYNQTYFFKSVAAVTQSLCMLPEALQLRLRFPGQNIKNAYTNQARVKLTPDQAQAYEGDLSYEDSILFKMTTTVPQPTINKRCTSGQIQDQMASKSKPVIWQSYVKNDSTSYSMENIVFTDYALDPRLKITGITLYVNTNFVGTVRVIAVDVDGHETLVTEEGSFASTNTISLPEGSTGLRMESTAGSYLKAQDTLSVNINTSLIAPDKVHYVGGLADSISNTAKFTATYQGINVDVQTVPFTANTHLLPYTPKFSMGQGISPGSVQINDILTLYLFLCSTEQALNAPDELDIQQIINLLPPGLDYVPGKTNLIQSTVNPLNADPLQSLEPTVVYNYKGTGRTALIWTYKKALQGEDTVNTIYTLLAVKAIVRKEMAEGLNTNEVYAIWKNNGSDPDDMRTQIGAKRGISTFENQTFSGSATDSLDFDGDGNSNEIVAKAVARFSYTPPREVIATKYVQGSLDTNYALTGGRVELGKDASYQLQITNKSLFNINKMIALDVLPHKNDLSIMPDANGNMTERGSQFPVYLREAITGPAGYSIYYTEELPGGRQPLAYASEALWTTAVADYAAVRGIKIVMDTGHTLGIDTNIRFTIPVRVEADPLLAAAWKANNSFAVATDDVNFVEATASSMQIIRYNVKGTVFRDLDANGLFSMEDGRLNGIKVSLLHEDGTVAHDLEGKPIESMTDANGEYSLDAFREGKYKLAFAIADDWRVIAPGALHSPTASHLPQGTTITDAFLFSADNMNLLRNAGVVLNYGELVIEKNVQDAWGTDLVAGEGPFAFTLMISGVPYTGLISINGVDTDVADGKLSFHSGDVVKLSRIRAGTSYQVTETDDGSYMITPPGCVVEGTINELTQKASFTNQEKALGKLRLHVVLKAATGNEIVPGRSIEVKVFGPSFPEGKTFTVTSGTAFVVPESLIFGEYRVEALNVDGYLVTVPEPVSLSMANKEGEQTVHLQEKAVPPPTTTAPSATETTTGATTKPSSTETTTGTTTAASTGTSSVSGTTTSEPTSEPTTESTGKPTSEPTTESVGATATAASTGTSSTNDTTTSASSSKVPRTGEQRSSAAGLAIGLFTAAFALIVLRQKKRKTQN